MYIVVAHIQDTLYILTVEMECQDAGLFFDFKNKNIFI